MRRRNVKPHCVQPCQPTGPGCQQGDYTISSSDTTQRFQKYIFEGFHKDLHGEKKNAVLAIIVKHMFLALFYFSKYYISWVTALPIDLRTTSQMVDVSLNFPSFQRSSSLKAVVNWCQSNPEYTLMESIYQPDNKKSNMNCGYFLQKWNLIGLSSRFVILIGRPIISSIVSLDGLWTVDQRVARGLDPLFSSLLPPPDFYIDAP